MNQGSILLIATSQDWGGVQAFLLNLAREMRKRGLPVTVCAGTNTTNQKNANELGERCRGAGIPFIELKHMKVGAMQVKRNVNPFMALASLFELISLFRRMKPSAVQLNSSVIGVIGSLAARLASVPWTVYCIGGWVFNENLPAWKKSLFLNLEKFTARWKDVIVCVNPGDERLARESGIKPRHMLTTIPNGIDIENFENGLFDRIDARRTLSLPITHPALSYQREGSDQLSPPFIREGKGELSVVGTVANAYPPKNLIRYLDVCRAVHDKNPDIRFVIVGDGPLMEDLRRRYAELKQEGYVLLAGRRTDAAKLYRAFDLFVLPSTKEGMPITILEAMAARLPIIATDVGACRWMLEPDAGVIVSPNDNQALAHAIIKLAADADVRHALGEQAYQQAKSRFTWSEMVGKTISSLSPSS